MQMVRQAERQTGNPGRLNHTVKLERGPDPHTLHILQIGQGIY